MARLPALIDAIAQFDGRGRPTLEHMARLIRQAGYIQTTKRGRGAAEMTENDAAALLIGVNATEDPSKTSDAVRLFSELRLDHRMIREADEIASDILNEVVAEREFAPALGVLLRKFSVVQQLEASSKEAYRRTSKTDNRASPEGTEGLGHGFSLAVTFHQPVPFATINMGWTTQHPAPRQGFATLVYHPKERVLLPASQRFAAKANQIEEADRLVTIKVGARTLRSIHDAMWPPDPNLK
jgi:hypothetical protein